MFLLLEEFRENATASEAKTSIKRVRAFDLNILITVVKTDVMGNLIFFAFANLKCYSTCYSSKTYNSQSSSI